MRYGYELLEDRYFSDYDYEDALYERAFSEGYEYAQREYVDRRLFNPEELLEMKRNGKKLAKQLAAAKKPTYRIDESFLDAYKNGIDYHGEGVPTREAIIDYLERSKFSQKEGRKDLINKLQNKRQQYEKESIARGSQRTLLDEYGLLKEGEEGYKHKSNSKPEEWTEAYNRIFKR